MALTETARRALDAYGGARRWREARTVRLLLSAGGHAFRLKLQPALVRARQEHAAHAPRVRCEGIDRAGHIGVLERGDISICVEPCHNTRPARSRVNLSATFKHNSRGRVYTHLSPFRNANRNSKQCARNLSHNKRSHGFWLGYADLGWNNSLTAARWLRRRILSARTATILTEQDATK